MICVQHNGNNILGWYCVAWTKADCSDYEARLFVSSGCACHTMTCFFILKALRRMMMMTATSLEAVHQDCLEKFSTSSMGKQVVRMGNGSHRLVVGYCSKRSGAMNHVCNGMANNSLRIREAGTVSLWHLNNGGEAKSVRQYNESERTVSE